MSDQGLTAGHSDPDFEAHESVPGQVGQKRTHPIVAPMPPVHAEAKSAQGKRDVIKDHQNVFRPPPKKARHRPDGPTALIHVGHGLDQEEITGPTSERLPFALELESPPTMLHEEIEDSEAHIVAGQAVFFSGVSETHDAFEAHQSKLTGNRLGEKKNALGS